MELTDAALIRVPAVLNHVTVRDFRMALQRASNDTRSAVTVLIGGEDGVFCRGMDFASMPAGETPSDALEDFAACLDAIRTGPTPVLCFVRGEVLGGGIGLVAASDGVLATPDAGFTLTELLFGLTPAMILPYLVERVSVQRLRWMALTAQRLDADAALRFGLVDGVRPAEDALRTLRSWIGRLRRVDRDVVTTWKRMTVACPPVGSREGLRLTLGRLREPTVRDRIRHFIETGEPPWVAREL